MAACSVADRATRVTRTFLFCVLGSLPLASCGAGLAPQTVSSPTTTPAVSEAEPAPLVCPKGTIVSAVDFDFSQAIGAKDDAAAEAAARRFHGNPNASPKNKKVAKDGKAKHINTIDRKVIYLVDESGDTAASTVFIKARGEWFIETAASCRD